MSNLKLILIIWWTGEDWCFTLSSTPAGTTMGLNESEWGQMGVTMIAGTEGWIIEAPAATAYAVDPVGVDTIRPSPWTETGVVTCSKYDLRFCSLYGRFVPWLGTMKSREMSLRCTIIVLLKRPFGCKKQFSCSQILQKNSNHTWTEVMSLPSKYKSMLDK